ncbi:MAG: PKD domain-containing protein, partial [Sphingobacteriaceae bacterium]
YYRRLVSSASCAAVVQNVSNSFQILVHPDAKAEFTATNTTGCVPFDLAKVIKPVLHDDLNGSYEWFANNISIGKGAVFPGYIIKNDGENINIKLIAASKFGCNSSELELNFNTIKTVSASFTKDQTKGCGPITVHFVNTSQPLNGGTYLWDFGNGQTSTQIQPNDVTFLQHPQNRDTTYKITLAVTTSCGTVFYVDSIHVRPKPKAVFTPDKTIGCSPFEITLTNQSAGLPNTYTYYFGNGEKQVLTDNQTIKYTYTTTKTDTLTLKLVTENECGKDSSFYKIVVYPNNVQAKLVVNGDNQFGCSPVTVNFYNNSTGANTFLWDFGDGNTTTTTKSPDVFVHTFTKPGVYNVKLTASNGCSTASTNQTITVYEQPLAAFTMQKLQYCVRDSVAFTNTSTQGNFAYRWDFGDGSFSNDNNPKHPYAKPGTYIITLTLTQSYANGSACTNTVSHTTAVLAAPDAAFLSNSGTLNCVPFTLQVSAAPVNALNPVWSFDDAASGTSNQAAGYTASHTFTKAGVYRVLLTAYNQNGCADSTSQLVRVTESPLAAFSPGDSVLCGTTATVNFLNKTT